MSLDVDGFTDEINGRDVVIHVDQNHRLLKLVNLLLKVAILTKTAAKALNQRCHAGHHKV